MRNISVPTNDTMIFAVHGDTVDECIANCAKLMAYLTSGAQPETTVEVYANSESEAESMAIDMVIDDKTVDSISAEIRKIETTLST